MKIEKDTNRIVIESDCFRMVWSRDNECWRDRIEVRVGSVWTVIAQELWHLAMDKSEKALQVWLFTELDANPHENGDVQVLAGLTVPDLGRFTACYHLTDDGLIQVAVEFEASVDTPSEAGLRALAWLRPEGYDRVRLYDLLPSGWSNDEASMTISSELCENAPFEQMSLTFLDSLEDAPGVFITRQALGLTYPPGYAGGRAMLLAGQRVSGNLRLYLSKRDMYGPVIEVAPGERFDPPATIDPPRYPYSTYIRRWCQFIRRPELWVELGPGMGLFHRGFYHFFRGKAGLKVSGVLRYDQRPDGSVIEPGVTENDRLIELAWGGVANVVVAETLFHLAEQGFWPEAEDRVRQMIEAILHFADGGFQVQDGPCRGAWWNGYIVEQRRFASRYGRAHVETPNQGFVNYFLYRLWSLGATRDPDLPRRIEHNCTRFLQSIERPEGGVEYARYTDGRTGQSRFYEDYTRGYACGTAMTALSWLCAWRLTGIPDYRQQAKRLFDFLVDETARNEWRFLEYDTTGADTAAPAWVLIALCEAIQDLDCPAYRQAADRTFDLLWILRYHVQPDMERYKAKEAVWGGRMLIKGGMVHGSTPGSRQGSHAAHIRYDFPLAFEQYWRLTGRSKAYAAMIGYLNFQTWHQFTRTDLPIGTGTTTEQCSLVWDYVQDTAQIKHSNPLVMLALTPWLQCLGTNAEITLAQRPDANSLCLDLHSLGEAPTWLEWDRPARIYDEGELIGPGPATRFVLPPRQRRRLKAIVACSDSSP